MGRRPPLHATCWHLRSTVVTIASLQLLESPREGQRPAPNQAAVRRRRSPRSRPTRRCTAPLALSSYLDKAVSGGASHWQLCASYVSSPNPRQHLCRRVRLPLSARLASNRRWLVTRTLRRVRQRSPRRWQWSRRCWTLRPDRSAPSAAIGFMLRLSVQWPQTRSSCGKTPRPCPVRRKSASTNHAPRTTNADRQIGRGAL